MKTKVVKQFMNISAVYFLLMGTFIALKANVENQNMGSVDSQNLTLIAEVK